MHIPHCVEVRRQLWKSFLFFHQEDCCEFKTCLDFRVIPCIRQPKIKRIHISQSTGVTSRYMELNRSTKKNFHLRRRLVLTIWNCFWYYVRSWLLASPNYFSIGCRIFIHDVYHVLMTCRVNVVFYCPAEQIAMY